MMKLNSFISSVLFHLSKFEYFFLCVSEILVLRDVRVLSRLFAPPEFCFFFAALKKNENLISTVFCTSNIRKYIIRFGSINSHNVLKLVMLLLASQTKDARKLLFENHIKPHVHNLFLGSRFTSTYLHIT